MDEQIKLNELKLNHIYNNIKYYILNILIISTLLTRYSKYILILTLYLFYSNNKALIMEKKEYNKNKMLMNNEYYENNINTNETFWFVMTLIITIIIILLLEMTILCSGDIASYSLVSLLISVYMFRVMDIGKIEVSDNKLIAKKIRLYIKTYGKNSKPKKNTELKQNELNDYNYLKKEIRERFVYDDDKIYKKLYDLNKKLNILRYCSNKKEWIY
jgi:hypothetical protein